MARNSALGDLRAAIESIVRNIMEERGDGVAPNDLVLARLKKDRSTLVQACQSQLIDMALTKQLNNVSRTKRSIGNESDEFDLFSGMGSIPKSVTITRGKKKDPALMKVSEMKRWMKNHSIRATETSDEDLKQLFRLCIRDAQSDDETATQIIMRNKEIVVNNVKKEFELIS